MTKKWKAHWRTPASHTEAARVEALQLVLRFAQNWAPARDLEKVLIDVFGRYAGALPPTSDWELYRTELLGKLRELARGDEVEFESPKYNVYIKVDGGLPSHEGHGLALRKAAIVRLLAEQGWRVAECERENCSNLFARTSNSRHCSPQCANAARAARYYKRHKEKADGKTRK